MVSFKPLTIKRISISFFLLLFATLSFFVITNFRMWQARAAATIIWDGGGDAISWNDPLNWDTDLVPISTDFVLIDMTTTVTIVEPLTVNSLVIGQAAGTVTSVVEFAYDAISIGPLTIATENLTIYPNSNITHKDATADTVVATINIDIQTGDANIYGSINTDSKGYPSGTGPGDGVDSTSGSSGAAHGGYGGDGNGTDGSVISYGSYTQPNALGSGGGQYGNTAGDGGGAVKLTVTGTTTITGSISANGGFGYVYSSYHTNGGGSGGSIWIDSGTIAGAGSLSVDGGGAGNDNVDGGAGAGGRIALYSDTNTLSNSQISAMGGNPTGDQTRIQKGGAGTIYIKDNLATNGDLIINNTDVLWRTTRDRVAYTQLDTTITVDNLTIDNYANVLDGTSLTVVDTLLIDHISHFDITNTVATDTLTILNDGSLYNQNGANITYTPANLSWPNGILIDNGGTFGLLSSGGDMTIPADATLYSNLPRNYTNVIINGVLSHTENTNLDISKINLTISGDITINGTGSINIDSKGFAQSEGPGAGTDNYSGSSGAAHSGYGGNGGAADGSVISYGSYTQPTTLGSGGGQHGSVAGAGGGAVRLTVTGTTTINGLITADGGYGNVYNTTNVNGGGSGGSIWIDSGTITGSGSLSVDGGGAGNDNFDAGGGGGGRISLYSDSNTFNTTQISAMGGKPTGDQTRIQKGGAGTIFIKDNLATNGDLIIDNEDILWKTTRDRVAYTPLDATMTLDNLTIDNYANVLDGTSLTIVNTLLVDHISHFDITNTVATDTLTILNDGSLYNQNGANITYTPANLSWPNGILIDNGGTFGLLSSGGDMTIPADATLYSNLPRNYTNVIINGVLSHTENTDIEVNKINLTVSGNMDINGTGSINIDNKGFAAGEGPGDGVDASYGGSGGAAHGGYGGYGETTNGSVISYGSYTQPTTLGSGGGNFFNLAGPGGGAVKLTVTGTTTISGTISADGGYGSAYSGTYVNGGGSGGSIWINSGTITGAGSLSVDGGGAASDNVDGGGGGGGRIALYSDTNTLPNSQISAMGGKPSGTDARIQKGGAGTIFIKDNLATNGNLIVNNTDTLWKTTRDRVAYTQLDATMTIDNLTIDNYANVLDGTSLTIVDTLLVDHISHFDITNTVATDTLTILNDGSLYNQNSANITYTPANFSWPNGILIDNGGTFALLSSGGDITIPTDTTLHSNLPRSYTNVIINGVLTHTENTDIEVNKINLTVSGNMDINGTGSINVTSKGYSDSNGEGAGVDTNLGAGGGGYGGVGGDGQTTAGGIVYGDELAPDRLGSGGGEYFGVAGHGGGAIKLDITGAINLNGSIISNGGYGYAYNNTNVNGGGSGGSIWVKTNDFNGTGLITANGGGAADDNYDGGGGGGGRIAIYFTNNNSNLAGMTTYGGVPSGALAFSGAEGTIFLGGISSDPINLRQYKSDTVTAIMEGGSTNEGEIFITFQVQDANASDVLTPEVEILPLGDTFNDIATDIGADVNYSGTIVTAEVPVSGLADGSEYHWQARVCDASAICSNWVSFGNNTEAEADIKIVTNTAPNIPSIPGSSFYINGQYTNFLQPTLSFVLSDPNPIDSVGYRIQINTTSDFTTPIIDYTSEMGAQTTRAFTVGQAGGTGSYTTGEEAQELSTGQYYWRVKTIDDKSGESDWSVAPGTPAFIIDLSTPTNASNVRMKAHVGGISEYTEGGETVWFNRNDPYYSWDAGSDTEGVKGYCIYLGIDPNGDPATEKGLLGTSPISTTGTTCQFITAQTEIDFANTALRGFNWLESTNSDYYFKIKTIDIANNTYSGPDETNFISFNFDNTAPENVIAISTSSEAFSSTSDMFFNWSTSPGQGGSDDNSGLLGFEYTINSQAEWFGEYTDTFTGLDYTLLTANQPYYFSTEVQALVQLGVNTVYFRTLDNAGNHSELRTAFINYGGEAPKFAPGDVVTGTPSTNTENSYSFSWPEATASDGHTIATYYYMINTTPPASYETMTSNSATYIATTETSIATASIPGLRKGANTIYVVAVDETDNYSPTNNIYATFTLDTELPDPPSNISIADSSLKDASIWRAAIVWDEPVYKGTGEIIYHIDRSDDGISWTELSTTNGLAYVDTVDESRQYYWRVGTTDNSDESIANPSYSSAVSIIPRGKYTSPATLTSGPASSSITTTKATISWTTNRDSDSKIAFGLASGNYFDSELSNSDQLTDHTVTLANLTPGTLYYYKAKWTDEDGNTGVSIENQFETAPPPEVKDVRISNLGISSTIVNFTTSNASSAKIYYGTTTSFGGLKEIATSQLETSYSSLINDLQDGTKYYYKINTFDAEGEEYEGTILDFTTLPRPKVSNILVQQVAKTAQATLLVTWDSNTPISSVVTYYPVNNPGLARDIVNIELTGDRHEMLLKDLFPDTEYILIVRGKDVIGNEAVSDTISIKTSTDSRAPQVSSLKIEGSNHSTQGNGAQTITSQLIITWETDEPSTSQIEYGDGTGDSYSQLSQQDTNLSTNHVVIISGLTPSKVYHLRAISSDSAYNETRSIDTVTITPKATNSAFYLVMTTLQEAFGFLSNF